MQKDRFRLIIVVNFLIEQDDKLLLMKRSDGFFKGGFWVAPGGHLDGHETIPAAAVREMKEELNIDVDENDVDVVHVVHNLEHTIEKLDVFVKVKRFKGIIRNNESLKCDELKFFPYNDLPSQDKMASTTIMALEGIKNDRFYSERGFIEKKSGFSKYDMLTLTGIEQEIKKQVSADKTDNNEAIILKNIADNFSKYALKKDVQEAEVIENIRLLLQLGGLKELPLKEIFYKAIFDK